MTRWHTTTAKKTTSLKSIRSEDVLQLFCWYWVRSRHYTQCAVAFYVLTQFAFAFLFVLVAGKQFIFSKVNEMWGRNRSFLHAHMKFQCYILTVPFRRFSLRKCDWWMHNECKMFENSTEDGVDGKINFLFRQFRLKSHLFKNYFQ